MILAIFHRLSMILKVFHWFLTILTFSQEHPEGSRSGPPPGWPNPFGIDKNRSETTGSNHFSALSPNPMVSGPVGAFFVSIFRSRNFQDRFFYDRFFHDRFFQGRGFGECSRPPGPTTKNIGGRRYPPIVLFFSLVLF